MPRDSSGNYQLPLAPVVGGDTIKADGWANPTLEDLRLAMEGSLSRDGQGGMRAPLQFGDGANTQPSITFTNENTSGLYREANADVRMVIGTQTIMQWLGDRANVYNPDDAALQQIATVDQLNAIAVPDGTDDGDRLQWDTNAGGPGIGGWTIAAQITAETLLYDPVNSTTPLTAVDVAGALDELDAIKTAEADFTAHTGDSSIHAPLTGATSFEVVGVLPDPTVDGVLYFVLT